MVELDLMDQMVTVLGMDQVAVVVMEDRDVVVEMAMVEEVEMDAVVE